MEAKSAIFYGNENENNLNQFRPFLVNNVFTRYFTVGNTEFEELSLAAQPAQPNTPHQTPLLSWAGNRRRPLLPACLPPRPGHGLPDPTDPTQPARK